MTDAPDKCPFCGAEPCHIELYAFRCGTWSDLSGNRGSACYESELDQLKADLLEAAGELLIPIPQPGTTEAKILSANVLLRNKLAILRPKAEAMDRLEQMVRNSTPTAAAVSLFSDKKTWTLNVNTRFHDAPDLASAIAAAWEQVKK